MNEERKHIEFIDENAEEKANRRGALRDFLDGSILIKNFMVKQLPYILFLTLIAVIYIANRYHAEKVYRKHLLLQNEIKEMRAEAITTASDLMYISKQSQVIKMVEERGLEIEESKAPPKKIVVKKKKKIQ